MPLPTLVRLSCLVMLSGFPSTATATQTGCNSPNFMTRADIRGLGLAEVRGQEIEVSPFGFAEYPTRCVTEDTIFEAASLTKPVVAYLAMRLVDQGRLGIDDALIDHLPSLPLPKDDPRSPRVTVRMALAHTTGLDGPDDQELGFVTDPGATFSYYPAGYRLVQRVVEHIEGESLEAIAQREVFIPLGMTSSSLVFREDLLDRIATRHRMLGDAFERTRDPARAANAAASLITTSGDYARFLRAMLDGEGLTEESRRVMLTPQIDVPDTNGSVAWGLGWGLEPTRGTFFHWGDDGAAKSFTIGSLEQDRALVYFANSYYGMAIAGEMAEQLVSGPSPAVEWLGYASWDDAKRLARRDTLRAFAEGDADQGMETFERYEREYPDLDMDNLASFLSWVLEGRGLNEGRARVLAWQIERRPDNVDLYLNLARSYQAQGNPQSAVATLHQARPYADESTAALIDTQLDWLEDDVLASREVGNEPKHRAESIEGTYGTWRVFSAKGRLVFQPGSTRQYQLRWMHGTTYALEDLDWFRLRFIIKDGTASKVIGRYSDGRTDENARGDG